MAVYKVPLVIGALSFPYIQENISFSRKFKFSLDNMQELKQFYIVPLKLKVLASKQSKRIRSHCKENDETGNCF